MSETAAELAFLEALNARLEDLTEKRTSFKGMIYGESGTGKTILSMMLAQIITSPDKNILHIDSGAGWVSLNDFPALKQRTRSLQIKGMSEFDILAEAIENKADDYWANIGCIVIDEYSTFADYDVLAVTRARAAKNGDKDADEPKLPDMGVSSNRMKRFTGPLIQLPNTHLIFVSHERTDKDNLNVPVISPKFMPGFGGHFRGLLHMVGHLTADEQQLENGELAYVREIQVHPTPRVVAKTRIGGFKKVRVSTEEFITAVSEWLKGSRETDTKDVIHPDPDPVAPAVHTENVDDLINAMEEG